MTEAGSFQSAASWAGVLPLVGALLMGASGVPGLLLGRRSSAGEWIAVALHGLGAVAALLGTALAFGARTAGASYSMWGLPFGSFRTAIDGLSAAFVVPLVLVPAMGSLYGLRYWSQRQHPVNGRKLRLFYGLLAASLVLVVIARDGVLFLLAWEIMALAAFFLVTTADGDAKTQSAGFIYFVTTHVGTLALFAFFALLASFTGSFGLDPVPAGSVPLAGSMGLFFLGLLGFGLKAGLMPLHVWLPGAHACAPSHVSAVLSGVVLKVGVYGLARMTCMLPHPPLFWGALLLAAGAASGVLGVVYAIAQHDLKRLLAYHSIENVGIIVMGLGLAMLGRSADRPDLIALGLGGALLHVWNHAFFKALLFLSAGWVIRQVHTHAIDRMGGLARTMPVTALLFLGGAVAICGLPPLNGFVSELLIYLGLLRAVQPGHAVGLAGAAFAVPVLAIIGALATACFVKVFGAVFLGLPRRAPAVETREAPLGILLPMFILAALCIAVGLLPVAALPLLDWAVATWSGSTTAVAIPLRTLVPVWWISGLAAVIWIGAVLGTAGLRRRLHAPRSERQGTWDCGYAAPGARMQYTASSFAQVPVSLFAWALHPREQVSRLRGPFPRLAAYQSHVNDVVLDEWIVPAMRWFERQAQQLRVLQTGRIQIYIVYVLIAVVALVLSIVPVTQFLRSLVTR